MPDTRLLHHHARSKSLSCLNVDNDLGEPGRKLTLSDPATYRIQVQGMLELSWMELLDGLVIAAVVEDHAQESHDKQTELVGTLVDQAALVGTINTLYSLGLPLISVTWVARQHVEP